MPNKKSATKELRKSVKRHVSNKKVIVEIKSLAKESRKAIDTKKGDAQDLVKKAIKALDKAAQKGVIKKNTASRRKSRLSQKLNKVGK
jgi:small subunit ribosomal protein S20